jgi:hypothetical protein
MSIYDQYPDFINRDPRINRIKPYRITKEFTDARYSCFFDIDLTDKSVLDLGSCVGSLGAWVLEKGAKFYRGVEFDKDLSEISLENLKKYFPKDKWDIQNTSVEEYLQNTDTKFDVVIASGILYAFFDPIPILEKISEIGNLIIIENRSQKNIIETTALDEAPYIVFGNTQRMIMGVSESEIEYYSSLPSIGFFKYYFKFMGFDYDASTHDRLKEMIPAYYLYGNRFALRFKKNNEVASPLGFVNSLENNPVLHKWRVN